MKYAKDTRKNNLTENYSGVYGYKVDEIALALINSCTYLHKDSAGEYVYHAVSFDAEGNVTFKRRNVQLVQIDNGFFEVHYLD